ncbi:aminotransferase class V-fold PLP-dependent enzyme [Oscillospiraceae bacterium LTW-04]|nr:aminotransferase class V-fold PLP-dependent enzyme [Oscillospiraceae bacterium MB24-C1]
MDSPRIYLNNAATSWPKPDSVAQAVAKAVTSQPGSANRGGIQKRDVFDEARRALAKKLGISNHHGIALGYNATWGLNLAILGFPFKKGDVVLTTKAEHNSVLRPLYKIEHEGRAKVVYLDTDAFGRVSEKAWREAVNKYRPALCIFNQASNVTGAVVDSGALTDIAKATGAVVLMDASQTLGWTDVRAEDWGTDMVAFTGHKYLLGPQGVGGLYVRPGVVLEPLLVGGTGIKSDMDTMPEEMPLHLEAGTGNEPSVCGLVAALSWAEANPLPKPNCEARMQRLKEGIQRAGAVVINPKGACTPVVSFNVPGHSAADVGDILTESYDIICRSGLHCAPRIFENLGCKSTVRLSLSRFTTDEEVDAVISAVRDIRGMI